jgi:hypothetical protein
MKVEVTRVVNIPTTTVDHTYDGEGYGLILKVEDNKTRKKSDVVMQEATPDDDSKDNDAKGKDVQNGADLPTVGGTAKLTHSTNQNQTNPSNMSSKQAQAQSLPMLKVGLIDCHGSPQNLQSLHLQVLMCAVIQW